VDKLRYRECQQSRRFIITVPPGAKLVEELRGFAGAVGLKMAAMVSAVGSIRNLTFTDIQMGPIFPSRSRASATTRSRGRSNCSASRVTWWRATAARSPPTSTSSPRNPRRGHRRRPGRGGGIRSCEIVLTEYVVEGVERHHSTVSGVDTLTFRET